VTSSTASAVTDAASFDSGSTARDKDVKSADFLHVDEHARIAFTSTQLARELPSARLTRFDSVRPPVDCGG
jgi:polyisoprenoid-binding protein YceI